MSPKLFTREQFKEQVFARDKGRCVFCGKPAEDAHHIMERKLWLDSGYYLDNGASVCAEHHMACETTELSVEDVRKACGITTILLPPHFSSEDRYDKWGNQILSNGQRLKGELFFDTGVQRVLGDKLTLFTAWTKYPRTLHLPWSPGLASDDKVIDSLAGFEGQEVVVTEKMDGENTTLYPDYMHARSLDSRHHVSRDWVKQFHATIRHDIPQGWRVCGENVYAQHSVTYDNLPTYFLGFSIWDGLNRCISWSETLEWFEMLGVTPVPVLYTGVFDPKAIQALWKGQGEGYVIRLARDFRFGEFRRSMAKFVRKGHVQTDDHWMSGPVTPNKLSECLHPMVTTLDVQPAHYTCSACGASWRGNTI